MDAPQPGPVTPLPSPPSARNPPSGDPDQRKQRAGKRGTQLWFIRKGVNRVAPTGAAPPPPSAHPPPPPPSRGSLRVLGSGGTFSRADRALSAPRLLRRGRRSSGKGLMPPSGHGQSLRGCASFHTCSGFRRALRAAQYLSAGGL